MDLDFEFPKVTSTSAVANDVVFCGKVMNGETQRRGNEINKNPFQLLRSESSHVRSNRVSDPVRRSDSGSRKHRSGLFGIVKFPLQMELSDIKMRQERREPLRLPLPELTEDGGSCWELVRPLRRRSHLMNALAKATFGCIPAF